MDDHNSKLANRKESPAQLLDKFLQRTAVGVFLLTIKYVVSAAGFVVSDELADHAGWLQIVLSILVLVVVFPAFLKYLNLHRKKECPDTSGYVIEMFKKSAVKAFSLTFVFLIAVKWMAGNYLMGLPTLFFINAILAFTLGVFSITFYLLLRTDDDQDPDDDFDTESGL